MLRKILDVRIHDFNGVQHVTLISLGSHERQYIITQRVLHKSINLTPLQNTKHSRV
jgi:hypothetical protein